MHPGLDAGVALEGEGERGGAGAGAHADVLDAGGDELVDEDADVAAEDFGVREVFRQLGDTPSPSP
jgi:hypothetical protein